MIEVKTGTGFKCRINERIFKDWEFMKHLGKIQTLSKNENNTAEVLEEFEWVLDKLLGGTDKLFAHIKKQNEGYVPLEAVLAEWKDIATAIPKN